MENSPELIRSWADVDSDEQEYLDLLSSFGEGFVDLTRMGINALLESGEQPENNGWQLEPKTLLLLCSQT